MASTSDFKNGMTLLMDGEVYQIKEFQHVKPGKGGAFVRSKLRKYSTGQVIDKTWRAGENVDIARVERRTWTFSYRDGDDFVFMEMENFEQITLTEAQIGTQVKFLKDNAEVIVSQYENRILGVDLPDTIEVRVASTDPGLKGDTASGGSKPATIETGATITVPLFVNEGDMIRVDTRSEKYIERVNS
jgi:elongation factor P